MCIYIYICTCVYVCVCVYIHAYINTNVYVQYVLNRLVISLSVPNTALYSPNKHAYKTPLSRDPK